MGVEIVPNVRSLEYPPVLQATVHRVLWKVAVAVLRHVTVVVLIHLRIRRFQGQFTPTCQTRSASLINHYSPPLRSPAPRRRRAVPCRSSGDPFLGAGINWKSFRDDSRGIQSVVLTVQAHRLVRVANAVLGDALVAAKVRLAERPDGQRHGDRVQGRVRLVHEVPVVGNYHFACEREEVTGGIE